MGDMNSVAVIVPQHGQSHLTLDCVISLQRFQQVPVIIVDDGSPAGSVHAIRSANLSGVDILIHSGCRGVTAAWNTGWRHSQSEFLVFLNNDTLSTGPWIEQLIEALSSSGASPIVAGVASRAEPAIPEQAILQGWCLAMRRSTLVAARGFDPRFRLYYSDTDLQLRLLDMFSGGTEYRCGVLRSSAGHHSGGAIRQNTGLDRHLETAIQSGQLHPALTLVEGLPISHLGHRTTRQHRHRNAVWRSDRERFLKKWQHRAGRGNEAAADS